VAVGVRTTRLYGPTELPSTITALYTVPADHAALIKSIVVCSNGTVNTWTLRINGTGAGKNVFEGISAPASGSTYILYPEIHLNAGDVVYGVASGANHVVMTISGFVYG
jgi:hypothetical protein